MKLNTIGELKYFTFDIIDRLGFVGSGFSTRQGGVSEEHLYSLNLGYSRGDERENVDKNYDILCGALGVERGRCAALHQVHSTDIVRIDKEFQGLGFDKSFACIDADGMITNEKDIVLVTYHADCVPLYFVDTKNKAIGMAHAGWKGTGNGMAEKMLIAMKDAFGTAPEDVIAAIGPSIGKCCYQVDEPVTSVFKSNYEFADEYIKEDGTEGKYKLDLWGFNKELLMVNGVKEENIDVGGICTKCNPELFYSHRNCGEKRGTMGAFLFLR